VRLGLDRLGDLVGFADHARDPLPELLVGIPARLRGRAERALGLGLRVAEQHAHELDLIGELLEVPPHLVRVVPAPDRHELRRRICSAEIRTGRSRFVVDMGKPPRTLGGSRTLHP
jgi:hypothetical protein